MWPRMAPNFCSQRMLAATLCLLLQHTSQQQPPHILPVPLSSRPNPTVGPEGTKSHRLVTIKPTDFLSTTDNPQLNGYRLNPGVLIRFSSRGIAAMSEVVSEKFIQKLKANTHVPDFHESFDGGLMRATNITFGRFPGPKTHVKLRQSATDSSAYIDWALKGGGLALSGHWSGQRDLKAKVLISEGTFTASATNLDYAITARLSSQNGDPAFTDIQCRGSFGRVVLKLRGRLIGRFASVYERAIKKRLTPALNDMICRRAVHFVDGYVNTAIGATPTAVPLSQQLTLDYGLVKDPYIPSQTQWTDLELKLAGECSIRGSGKTPFFPQQMVNLEQVFPKSSDAGEQKMVYIRTGDYVLNSLLYWMHELNQTSYTIDRRTRPQDERYLRTSCADSCLGTLYPELKRKFPNSETLLELSTSRAPTVEVTANKTSAIIIGKLAMKFRNAYGTFDALEAEWKCTGTVQLRVVARGTYYEYLAGMRVRQLDFRIIDSRINTVKEADLGKVFYFLSAFIEEQANNVLKKGVVLPLPEGMMLKNIETATSSRTFEIGADFSFKPNLMFDGINAQAIWNNYLEKLV